MVFADLRGGALFGALLLVFSFDSAVAAQAPVPEPNMLETAPPASEPNAPEGASAVPEPNALEGASVEALPGQLPELFPSSITEMNAKPAEARRVSNEDLDLLGAWLDHLEATEKRSRKGSGSLSILAGAVLGTLGGLWYAGANTEDSELVKGWGMLLLVPAGITLGGGIATLAVPGQYERLNKRFRDARIGGMSEREFGRFESQLGAFPQEHRNAQRASRLTGLGMLVSGGLILGLTPVADLSSESGDLVGAYVAGGTITFFGLLTFSTSFGKKQQETNWDTYLQGEPPSLQKKRRRAQISPAVSRHTAC